MVFFFCIFFISVIFFLKNKMVSCFLYLFKSLWIFLSKNNNLDFNLVKLNQSCLPVVSLCGELFVLTYLLV